jgi:geranylgeranyl reductase family protein
MERYDVVVVGAGPAGSTAARYCASGGLRTLLLEKERLPRSKLCAGGLTSAAAAQLDLPLPAALVERECRSVVIRYREREQTVRFSLPLVYTVTRSAFDRYLADKAVEAGADLRQGEPCLGVAQRAGEAVVRTPGGGYAARLVIGADGVWSAVARSLSGRGPRRLHFCLAADIPLAEEQVGQRFPHLYIHYGFPPGGYAWIFPRRRSVSAGLGTVAPRGTGLPLLFREFLIRHGLPPDVRSRGGFVSGFSTGRRLVHGRVLLAGDAAGFADSFSGEGIRYAMLSGRLAARTAVEAFASEDFSTGLLGTYQERCLERFGGELALSARIAGMLERYSRPSLGILIRDQGTLSEYLQTAAGTLTLGEFISRLKRRFPLLFLKGLLAPR